MKKGIKEILIAILAVLLLGGCGGDSTADTDSITSASDKAFYDDERLVSFLISDDWEVETMDNTVFIDSMDGESFISIEVFPGIQNIKGFAESFMEGMTGEAGEAISSDELANPSYTLSLVDDEEDMTYDFYIQGANQAVYLITYAYGEADTLRETLQSITPLVPEAVSYEDLTGTYKDVFEENDVSEMSLCDAASDITKLPFDCYGEFWQEELYESYDLDFYREENLKTDSYSYPDLSAFWSYGWDKDRKWKFYEEHMALYQKGEVNEAVHQAEQKAQESVDSLWNYDAGALWGGVTREQYNNALNLVNALESQYKKNELSAILQKADAGLSSQEQAAQAASDAEAQAAAQAAAAQAAAAQAAAAQAAQSDPGDTGDYEYDMDNYDRYDAYDDDSYYYDYETDEYYYID